MAELVLKSEAQILGDMIARFLADSGVNDLNKGSVVRTFLEAAAQEDFQQYIQMLTIIRNYNLDTTSGEDLENRAFEFGLEREAARTARDKIEILRPASFEKVSTRFYAGKPAPVAGDTIINVNDASNALYATSGTLILGRGTSNEEEVSYTTAPVNNTNFYTFTLTTSVTQNHGLDETVILKQGSDETISAGTVVRVKATTTSPEIRFTIDSDVVLEAGEDKVSDVEITAVEAGSSGNIPSGAITGTDAFVSAPFSGARAQNTGKFTTGRDIETDESLRARIKSHIQSLSKGTESAILNAIVGLLDTTTAKRVVSANVVLPTTTDDIVKIYIDDGTGFEPSFEKIGYESLVATSRGGEQRLQLDLYPLVKAQLETTLAEPYDFGITSKTLLIEVGINTETITFSPVSDFEFPDAATAEEVVAAINNKSTLIEARTSQTGKKLVISAIENTNEDIQVTGGTANDILSFPTDKEYTLYLYKDDTLLSKDGETATLDCATGQNYDFTSISAPWVLNVIVDGKSANSQTVTFDAADFTDTSAATAAEVIAVINDQLAGARAELISSDTKVRLISNKTLSSGSKLQVTGGNANGLLGFPTTETAGRDKDYTLNRYLGLIELATALSADQNVTVGSRFTRSFLRTVSAELYSITAGQTLVVSVDGGADQTITFASTGSFTAAQIVTQINAQAEGFTAISRTVGVLNYVEIRTNTYAEASGSIEVDASSTATALDFATDTVETNRRPHTAYLVSGSAGPYTFVDGDVLVVVVDNDFVFKTFSVFMDYDGTATSGASTTVWADTSLATVFDDDEIVDCYAVFKSGNNTTTGDIGDITNTSGDTWRYAFDSLPTNLADFASGDMITIEGCSNTDNNGTFLLTAVDVSGTGYIEITNADGVAETGSAGTCTIMQRRQVTDFVASTGSITVGSAFRATPASSDTFVIIPSTIGNMVDWFNNLKVTTLSNESVIESVENNTKLQISSLEDGSDGAVQVTGGTANTALAFSTSISKGLKAYSHSTGLVKEVHTTLYGDDEDLVSSPGVSAAGIFVDILSPTIQEISFNIAVTLEEGINLSSVEDSVKSEVTGYVNSLGIGSDVILEEIRARIIRLTNIVDVSLTSPTANVAIADNEKAKTRDSLISVN